MPEKIAYTPAEFAALFSREKTWTYRQLYDGKIDAITTFGRTMIPASQIARIEGTVTRYHRKPKTETPTVKAEKEPEHHMARASGNSQWLLWIEKRREKAKSTKQVWSRNTKSP